MSNARNTTGTTRMGSTISKRVCCPRSWERGPGSALRQLVNSTSRAWPPPTPPPPPPPHHHNVLKVKCCFFRSWHKIVGPLSNQELDSLNWQSFSRDQNLKYGPYSVTKVTKIQKRYRQIPESKDSFPGESLPYLGIDWLSSALMDFDGLSQSVLYAVKVFFFLKTWNFM